MQYSLVLVGAQTCPSVTCPRKTGEDSSHLATSTDPRSQYSLVGRASHFLPGEAVLVHRLFFQTQLTCWCEVSWERVFPQACKTRTSKANYKHVKCYTEARNKLCPRAATQKTIKIGKITFNQGGF